MREKPKTVNKVIWFQIHKPAGDMTWKELGNLLREARYRVFRLANLAVTEKYLSFHMWRTGQEYKSETIGKLNRRLREMLIEEGVEEESQKRFSATGALPDTVVSTLAKGKLAAITSKSKWKDVVNGKTSLPTFKLNMAIPVRCDKAEQRRLRRTESGDVELDLMICKQPYPRVVLKTGKLKSGQRAILDRLVENNDNSKEGYSQRVFEIKQVENNDGSKEWRLYISYTFPKKAVEANADVAVGVDIGFSVPLVAAVNSGLERLGYNDFRALNERIRSLQRQVLVRRRSMQSGGRDYVSTPTARSGHGRKRRILPIQTLRKRWDNAYTTLNHQLSHAVVSFAENHGAATIQIENVKSLKDELRGTFLGQRWRYFELQQFLKYKADEVGIELREVNARYTSRRCSECGYINMAFTRQARDKGRVDGKPMEFVCPECGYKAHPDYNAARNIAMLDIEQKMRVQCKQQGITYADDSEDL